ncbi:hypothetical protein ACIBVL_33755 [Streptomyces sp. NPDC049687]|uniref:hypothetical protein n=1 Tax=Streptomyces sp. NPDC049687 TaxID=3365596 RepID=UPI003797A5CB
MTAAAWTLTVLTIPVMWLVTVAKNRHTRPATLQDTLAGWVVPIAVVVALAAGSAASWTVWVVSRRRARSVDLYRVWLITAGLAVGAILVPWVPVAEACHRT